METKNILTEPRLKNTELGRKWKVKSFSRGRVSLNGNFKVEWDNFSPTHFSSTLLNSCIMLNSILEFWCCLTNKNVTKWTKYIYNSFYCLGEGDDGKLGHGNKTSCDRPRVVEALRGKDVINVSCGGAHSAAITATGFLFIFFICVFMYEISVLFHLPM